MKANDARRFNTDQLEKLRTRGFALLRKGHTAKNVSKVLGVATSTVYKWKHNAKLSGIRNAIRGGKRGRPKNSCRKLEFTHLQNVLDTILQTTPDMRGLDCNLWTRSAVQEMIKKEYGTEFAISTVGAYMRNWEMAEQFTRHQKNGPSRDYEKWHETNFQEVQAAAKTENALIYRFDFTPIRPGASLERFNMYSATSCNGTFRFWMRDEPLSDETFTDFLKALTKDTRRKVHLIAHVPEYIATGSVSEWESHNSDRIKLIFLPY